MSASTTFLALAAAALLGIDPNAATWLNTPSPTNLRTALDQGTPGNGTTGTGKVVYDTSPTIVTPNITTSLTITNNGLSNNATPGLILSNNTASDGTTTRQNSPDIELNGTAFNTVSGLNETQRLRIYMQPNSAAGATTNTFVIRTTPNGGASTNPLTLTSAGSLTALTSIIATTSITAGAGLSVTSGNASCSAGAFTSIRAGITTTNTIGFNARNSTATVAGTLVQQSPDYQWEAHASNTASGNVDEQHDWRAFVLPVTAAGPTSATWKLARQIAGGGYADMITVSSNGTLTTLGSIASGSTLSSSGATAVGSTLTVGTTIATTAGSITATGQFIANRGTSSGTVEGLRLATSTTSTSGNPRDSLYATFRGTGFNVTAAASQISEFAVYNRPIQLASNEPAGELRFDFQTNSLGFTNMFKLLSQGGMFVANDTTVPGTPTGGGVFYVEAGAYKYKGSSGTVTTLAAA